MKTTVPGKEIKIQAGLVLRDFALTQLEIYTTF
jgi:hypothetical protein